MSKISNFFDNIRNKKNIEIIIAIILGVIVLVVFLADFDFFKGASGETDDLSSYDSALRQQIVKTLSKIDGVGKVEIAITYESGARTVYAKETTHKTSADGTLTTNEEIVMVGGEALIECQLQPQIKGIVLVIEGGDSWLVKLKVINALKVLLGVEEHQIQIDSYR
ncbi:MAG: hypothetical protein PHW00_04755 [Clostridia bacterium]|nr:hypothetical protein [Clostridia bacterium]